MTKQTGWILTAVAGVIALCCLIFGCGFGITTLTGVFQNTVDIELQPWVGVVPICLSFIVILAPILLWYFLVRGKNGEESSEVPTATEPPAQ